MATFGQGVRTEVKTITGTSTSIQNTTIYTVPSGRFAYIVYATFGGAPNQLEKLSITSTSGSGGSTTRIDPIGNSGANVPTLDQSCLFNFDPGDTTNHRLRCMGPGDTIRINTADPGERDWIVHIVEYF